MVPFEDLNKLYEAQDRYERILMVQIDVLKEIVTFSRIRPKPDKKVETFDVPLGWFKTLGNQTDFGAAEICEIGQIINFGKTKIPSKDLINWFAVKK